MQLHQNHWVAYGIQVFCTRTVSDNATNADWSYDCWTSVQIHFHLSHPPQHMTGKHRETINWNTKWVHDRLKLIWVLDKYLPQTHLTTTLTSHSRQSTPSLATISTHNPSIDPFLCYIYMLYIYVIYIISQFHWTFTPWIWKILRSAKCDAAIPTKA